MAGKVVICGINTDSLPRLTQEESLKLLLKAKSGDAVAREQFLLANLRLVLSIIKRFSVMQVSTLVLIQQKTPGHLNSL